MKKILYVIAIILAALIVVAIFRAATLEDGWVCVNNQWVKHGNPAGSPPTQGCGNPEVLVIPSFEKTGRIVMNSAGLKPDTAYFLYEEPGSPALTLELKFNSISICTYNGTAGKCPDILLTSSTMTKVMGTRMGDTLQVVTASTASSTP